jgi:hypothetical protein
MRDDQGDDITDALDRLHAGGWSIGDTAFHDIENGRVVWVVSGTNGENMIRAEVATWRGGGHSILAHRMRDG